jgi:uncharacterized membrane protein HdeD (DUF308 family)
VVVIGFCEKWWMISLRGSAALAFGLVVLAWPSIDARSLSVAFGVFALVDGLVLAGVSVVGRDVLEQYWIVLAEGVVGLVVGIVALSWHGFGGLGLLSLLAGWAILTGFFEVEAGERLRRLVGELSLLVAGGLSLFAGIALVALPKGDPVDVAWAIGLFGIVYAGILAVVAERLRHLARAAQSLPRT